MNVASRAPPHLGRVGVTVAVEASPMPQRIGCSCRTGLLSPRPEGSAWRRSLDVGHPWRADRGLFGGPPEAHGGHAIDLVRLDCPGPRHRRRSATSHEILIPFMMHPVPPRGEDNATLVLHPQGSPSDCTARRRRQQSPKALPRRRSPLSTRREWLPYSRIGKAVLRRRRVAQLAEGLGDTPSFVKVTPL